MNEFDLLIANNCSPIILANRDPTEKDNVPASPPLGVIWVSKEYTPNRVFRGDGKKWRFIGKFHAVGEDGKDTR